MIVEYVGGKQRISLNNNYQIPYLYFSCLKSTDPFNIYHFIFCSFDDYYT